MTSFVADASVGISWAVPSQANAGTDRLWEQLAAGVIFVIPSLWMIEVANSLLLLARRARMSREERKLAWEQIQRLRWTLDDATAFGDLLELADRYTLTSYDACYLELARRRGLPLASRDSRLNKAARRCGIQTLL